MGIMFKEILDMSCFNDAVLLSGEDNIENISVEGITIVERPDIANWIKGGELLLTSFYSIENNLDAQIKLVEEVAKNGAAGIVIKTSVTYERISQTIIDKSNAIGFPIIEIPRERKYIDILYPVMGILFNDQVMRLNYYKECHVRFNNLSLSMKGIESVAQTLEELINNPVIIFDNEMRILAYSDENYSDLNIVEKKMRKMVYEGYPIFGIDMKFEKDDTLYHLTVEPIEVVNKIQAYLGIVEVNSSPKELDFIALESAANTLRLEILKQTAVNESQLRYKGDLMEDLINGKYDSLQSMYDRGFILGWDLRKSYNIGIFSIKPKSIKMKESLTEWLMESRETVKTIIDRIAYHHTTGLISIIKGEEIIVFWPVEKDEIGKDSTLRFKEFGTEVRNTVKKRLGDVSVNLGIGCLAEDMTQIGRSYNESKDAVNFGKRIFGEDGTTVYEELGIYRMLCSFEDRNVLVDFIPQNLLKLKEYDKEKNNDLIDTFEMYLKCNLNAVKTAEELFVHYKTVLYRLNRIKEITNLDIDDRDKMLELEVGLKILKIIG